MIDRLIAELADRQHGVVATWQLVALGLTHDDIGYRAQSGRLHRIHRGVYAVGYRKLTRQGHRMAPSSPTAPTRCSATAPQRPTGTSARARTGST